MTTKLLTTVEGAQQPLPLHRAVTPEDVSLETIVKRRSMLGAINLMIDVSGLEDKELYSPLDIDAGHWSKMRKGQAQFPVDERLGRAMDMCASEVPLIWLANSRGYGIHLLESEAARQLRAERELRIEAEKKVDLLTGILKRQA